MESARKSHAISVARTLPIDGALVHDILLRLRRDSAGTPLRWTLGDRGIVEIDVNFSSVTAATPSWTASARVWDNRGLSLVGVSLRIKASADTVTLALVPSSARQRASKTFASRLIASRSRSGGMTSGGRNRSTLP